MNKVWKKLYECDCYTEGVVLSYEDYWDEIPDPCVELAFFKQGFDGSKQLYSFGERLRWCWQILRHGTVWCDMVMLSQSVARDLGKDLVKFSYTKVKK